MKLLFLGTGTSTGVPQIGCGCPVCHSIDPCDKRLRASAILQADGTNILIDCGPDLRTQLLRAREPQIDAVLVTHSHYDHIGGLIDLRSYALDKPLPIYCTADVERDIRAFFPYCFYEKLYPGVPRFEFHRIVPGVEFDINGVKVMPVMVMHYKLPIVGFRVGDFAYVTDCKTMPESSIELLSGVHTLVINALRIKEHMSHMTLAQALEVIDRIDPQRAYLTHISCALGFSAQVSASLPPRVRLAHDFMSIRL